jgi:hypothetical protein
MRKFLSLISIGLFFVSFHSYAGEVLKSSDDQSLNVLELVTDVHQTYSQTSGLEAKVVQILAGDGLNASRMVLVLNSGFGEAKNIFVLPHMMVSVKRITFSAKDTIVINYDQDGFEGTDLDKQVITSQSLQIKVLRNSKGELNGKIEYKDL